MKIIKKIMYITIIVILSLFSYATISKAANTTLEVTTDTLNLRKKASTDSDILTLLSIGDQCELIEKDGDWYKVKYGTYTGYVSKEYVKEKSISEEEDTSASNNTENKDVDQNSNNQEEKNDDGEDQKNNEQILEVVGKISKKTDVKLLPLIYSSKIVSLNKNNTITIIAEMNGWTYIQTDTVTGWIRSNVITDKKNVSNTTDIQTDNSSNKKDDTDTKVNEENQQNESNQEDNDTNSQEYTEKTMYINDSYVNLRKEASTSSDVIMVVELNTKLTVIGESGDWYQVKTSSGNAYVSKKLLSERKTTTSRSGEVRTDNSNTTTEKNTTTTTNSTVTETNNETKTSVTSSSSVKGTEVVNYAKQFLGVPYVYGGASKSGFDCSGFTMYVYKNFGISMRHGAQAQAKLGTVVNADKSSASSLKQNLQPGDLVFFLDYETMDEIGHCGIYIGDGNFIHASSGSGYCVKINSLLPGEYYNTRYCAARRII